MPAQLPEMEPAERTTPGQIPASVFRRACREIELARYPEQAILVSDSAVTIGKWDAEPDLLPLVAERVRSTCDAATSSVQILYAAFGDVPEAYLIYVKPVNGQLLALITGGNRSLRTVRRMADWLSSALTDAYQDDEANANEAKMAARVQTREAKTLIDEDVYAIAWRPVEPLPLELRSLVRESAQRQARQEMCHLRFVGVASDHVHLVLQCPSRRKGSWAATVIKRAIEADMAHRHGTAAALWQKGFLADHSSEPIGGEELLAYLSH